MKRTRRFLLSATFIFATALFSLCTPDADATEPADAGTQVLKWKDGKKAAFMLGFDDSAPSQLRNVVPELAKRKIVGNFYLVTGNSLYASLKRRWEDAVAGERPGVQRPVGRPHGR